MFFCWVVVGCCCVVLCCCWCWCCCRCCSVAVDVGFFGGIDSVVNGVVDADVIFGGVVGGGGGVVICYVL